MKNSPFFFSINSLNFDILFQMGITLEYSQKYEVFHGLYNEQGGESFLLVLSKESLQAIVYGTF